MAVWIAIVAVAILFIIMGFFQQQVRQAQNDVLPDNTNSNSNNMIQDGELSLEDVIVGEGQEAQSGDTVTVHYVGKFADGSTFDSSVDRGQPFTFTLGQGRVIAGWEQGVVGMREGGVRKLVIPPELGYGPNDYQSIPGNSTLYFEVQLLEVQ